MSDIDDLIDYLDVGLDLATLDEMPLADLARLKELLHHWHALTASAWPRVATRRPSDGRRSRRTDRPT